MPAITNNGTRNSLAAAKKPAGYTSPTITTFTDYEYVRTLTLSVLKSTVDEATSAATMTAIFDDGAVGLDAQVVAIVAADFLTTPTVTTWADLIALTHNEANVTSGDGTWLTDTAVSYVATVKLYVKTV